MEWTKAPEEMVELFYAALPEDPALQRRKMFGYPCAVVNGHIFTRLHGARMIVRLPEQLLEEFLELDGAEPFEPMPGRLRKGYAVVPDAVLRDPAELRGWVERAFASAASLPAKTAKPAKTARARAKKKTA